MAKNIESSPKQDDSKFYEELRFSEERENKERGTADAVLEGNNRAFKIHCKELEANPKDKGLYEKSQELAREDNVLREAMGECGGANVPAMQAFDEMQKIIDRLEEKPKKDFTERDKKRIEATQRIQQKLLREAEA